MAEKFFETYLNLKEELIANNLVRRPDPAMVLIYYLYQYTDVREPRAIHTLLNVSMDTVLHKLVMLGLIELPPKDETIFRAERKRERVIFPKRKLEVSLDAAQTALDKQDTGGCVEVHPEVKPQIDVSVPEKTEPVIKPKPKGVREPEDVNEKLKGFLIE